MNGRSALITVALIGFSLSSSAQTQTPAQASPTASSPADSGTQPVARPQQRSPGGDVGSGAGDIGKGAGKGAGDLAKGAGKGAVDLVTLHPVNAAADIGKGGVSAGKNVAVGAGKGTGKILKGAGRGIRKLF